MKKTFFYVVVLFIIFVPSISLGAVTGLTAELERIERVRSSFPELDGISFFVKVTNTTSAPIYNSHITARVLKSAEYEASGGVFAGMPIEVIGANQSTTVELGHYLIDRKKTLKGNIEFAFDTSYIESGASFKSKKVFTSSLDAKKLNKSIDIGRAKIDIKSESSSSAKKNVRDGKEVKLLSFSLKSNSDLSLISPGFSYWSKTDESISGELANLTLWSGKQKICGPVEFHPMSESSIPSQGRFTFENCSIDVMKKKKVITLTGDISDSIPKGAARMMLFSGYSFSKELDINSKKLKPVELKFK